MEFKVLSLKEEEQLSNEELKEYYKNLREYLLQRKLTNTTPGATTIAPKLKGVTNMIANTLVNSFSSKDVKKICTGLENIPEGPVVFAHTHQSLLDGFVWIPQLDQHVIILHHQDINKILLLCQLNTGLILVKKDDNENMANAKLDLMSLLLRGHSVAWFPEGTYNLSPNKFHLPLKYGLIDVARKTGAPIVPVAHEFTYDYTGEKAIITKIQTKYGMPIYVSESDNLLNKLEEYSESISTLKFEIFKENGVFKRDEITNFEYVNFLRQVYKAIDFSKADKVKEQESIYKADDDFYKFHHLNDIPFTEDGILLETEEVRRLKSIDEKLKIDEITKMLEDLRVSERKKVLSKKMIINKKS